jgi:hypothetical protein
MATRLKGSFPRSEIRTLRDANDHNYMVFRFWDNKNNNWEYHVYAEVVAKEAARDIAAHLNMTLPSSETHNVRQLWDFIWEEKLTY